MNKRNFALAIVALLIGIFLVNFVQTQQEKKAKEEAAQLARESMDLSDAKNGLSKGDRAPDFERGRFQRTERARERMRCLFSFEISPLRDWMRKLRPQYVRLAKRQSTKGVTLRLRAQPDGQEPGAQPVHLLRRGPFPPAVCPLRRSLVPRWSTVGC